MLFQSSTAKRRMTPPVPYQAGMVAFAVFEHKFTRAFTAATDMLEIGSLPAGAKLIDATLISAGMTTGNLVDVGVMNGEAGDDDETRTMGAEIFTGRSINAEHNATLATCLSFPAENKHRGLGVTLTANEAAGPSKILRVAIRYTY